MLVNPLVSGVTWFSSAQSGSPKINTTDTNGLIKVLDACLVTGWGEKQVLTTSINEGLIIFDFGAGHGFNLHQNIIVSGATDPLLDGQHKVVAVTNNTATIKVIGALDNSGTIKVKIAPLGYESIFGTTNPLKRAYRSLASSSSKNVIYLDMDYAKPSAYNATYPSRRAAVSVCRDMTELGVEIGSITSQISPKTADSDGNLYWHQFRGTNQSSSISDYPLDWMVVGNGDFFYIMLSAYDYSKGKDKRSVFGFGEFIPMSESQNSRVFLLAQYILGDYGTLYASDLGATFNSDSVSTGTYIYSNAESSTTKHSLSNTVGNTKTQSGKSGGPYPTPYGNFLLTTPLRVIDSNRGVMGFMPSMLFIDHNMAGAFDNTVIDGVLIVSVSTSEQSSSSAANLGFYVGE